MYPQFYRTMMKSGLYFSKSDSTVLKQEALSGLQNDWLVPLVYCYIPGIEFITFKMLVRSSNCLKVISALIT